MPKSIETSSLATDMHAFGEATRIPIPEKTLFQELLDRPIPLENRVAHLVAYLDANPSFVDTTYSHYSIASQIGADPRWVGAHAHRIGLDVVDKVSDENGREATIFASPAFELLREEFWWYSETRDFDKLVQVREFERLLGKTEKWVVKYAYELGYVVEYFPSQSGGRTMMLPREALDQLRHVILSFLPQQDWYTGLELSRVIKHDQSWFVKNLGRAGVVSELRWSDQTGKLLNFYPPESPELVRTFKKIELKPAGSWLTEAGIAHRIGMTEDWTRRKLKKMEDKVSQYRVDDYNHSRLHYSPRTVARMDRLAAEVKSIPEAEDWFNVSELARQLEVNETWVRRRLPYLKSTPERRRNSVYMVFNYYPPEAIEELSKMEHIKFSDLRPINTALFQG